jgi:hypothetical protein
MNMLANIQNYRENLFCQASHGVTNLNLCHDNRDYIRNLGKYKKLFHKHSLQRIEADE